MLNDNLSEVWTSFFQQRTVNLFNRFDGMFRALVVETNDPLQMQRIRWKSPDFHDFNMKVEDCPWAVPGFALGGKNAGLWESAMIGDMVWISFEKAHVYGPIWTGFAPGTRRRRYPLEQIYTKSPIAVDKMGKPTSAPVEYLIDYLPKDYRPMANGWRDRYGNSEVDSFVGFFPIEHDKDPDKISPKNTDALANANFTVGKKPLLNRPDRKYLARTTKYGIYCIHSDIGYFWKKKGDVGEFKGIGDPLDEGGSEEFQFEEDRYKYFVKLYNENDPNTVDEFEEEQTADRRRYEIRTRVGHKFEMRDVGYAQKGGGRSVSKEIKDVKSRVEEGKYGGQMLSKWKKTDERWIKLRSKGGMIFQMMDTGFHPDKDEFYKKKLLEECGTDSDKEKDAKWTERDARQIRMMTRYGVKFVLDDRGTHPIDAVKESSPRGLGWLLKTRRAWEEDPDGGTDRGFGFEAVDRDELNTTRWYTPKSKCIEMNDRKDYCLICSDMSTEISRPCEFLDENEFATSIAMTFDPEKDTYHLKLDKRNGYIRLKTGAGFDNKRRPKPEPEKYVGDKEIGTKDQEAKGEEMKDAPDLTNEVATGDDVLNQGMEARDGKRGGGEDGAWTELVDLDHRGIWLSRKYGLGIWRSNLDKDQFIMIMDIDGQEKIVIRNHEDGPIQIYCKQDVQIVADRDINLYAKRDINMEAEGTIRTQSGAKTSVIAGSSVEMDGGGGMWQLNGNATTQSVPDNAPEHTGYLPYAFPGAGAQSPTGGGSATEPPGIAPCQTEDHDKTYPVCVGPAIAAAAVAAADAAGAKAAADAAAAKAAAPGADAGDKAIAAAAAEASAAADAVAAKTAATAEAAANAPPGKVEIVVQSKREPVDRAETENDPFDEVPEKVITVPDEG